MAKKPWENNSGATDRTAYLATKAISEEEQKVADLVWIFKKIARWAGLNILNRVEFQGRESERFYR